MSSLPDEAPPPPTDESRRLWLTRRLLRSACRCYMATLAFALEVGNSAPNALDDLPRDERDAWRLLKNQANAAFDAAEVALAERIVNLYDALAPEGCKIETRDDGVFLERAVRLDGTTYCVTADPAYYQPETGIIALLPPDRVVDLDG